MRLGGGGDTYSQSCAKGSAALHLFSRERAPARRMHAVRDTHVQLALLLIASTRAVPAVHGRNSYPLDSTDLRRDFSRVRPRAKNRGVPVVYLHLKRNEARPTSERDDTRSLAARARKRRQPRLLGALAGRASIAAGSDRPAARRINACAHASPRESRHYSRAEHSSEHCSRSKAYRRCWTVQYRHLGWISISPARRRRRRRDRRES